MSERAVEQQDAADGAAQWSAAVNLGVGPTYRTDLLIRRAAVGFGLEGWTHIRVGPAKAAANVLQHSVSFQEATTVFQDRLAKIHDDPDHSAIERRDIIVGHSLRLISARPVTKRERRDYEETK